MTDERAEAFRGRVTKWELKSVFADGKDVSDPQESWRIGTDPASLTLTLSLIDDENNNAASVLCFHNVVSLKLEELDLWHLVWLTITDISDKGWDASNYEVRDVEDTTSFYCKSYTVTS